MKAPLVVIVASVMAITCVHQARGASCTAPMTACAAEQSPSASAPEKRRATLPAAKRPDPAKREALRARTANCMRAHGAAILRQGILDESTARISVVSHCSKEMHEWNQREEGSTEEESFALLDQLAGKALDAERDTAAPCAAPTPACAAQLPAIPAPMSRTAQKGREADRAQFLKLYAYTADCMRTRAALALQGNVHEDAVNGFLVQNCAGALHGWFTREDGLTEDQSLSRLDSMASDAIAAERAAAAPKPPPREPALPSFDDIQKRDAFLKLWAQSDACMRQASLAAMRHTRDRDEAARFNAGVCGGSLRAWLNWQEKSFTDAQIDALLLAMAYQALNSALRGPDAIIVR